MSKSRDSDEEYEAIWDEEETKITRSPHKEAAKKDPKGENNVGGKVTKTSNSTGEASYEDDTFEDDATVQKKNTVVGGTKVTTTEKPSYDKAHQQKTSSVSAKKKEEDEDRHHSGYSSDDYSDSEKDEAPNGKGSSPAGAKLQGEKKTGHSFTFTAKGAPSSHVRGTMFPTNVQVIARIRPFTKAERDEQEKKIAESANSSSHSPKKKAGTSSSTTEKVVAAATATNNTSTTSKTNIDEQLAVTFRAKHESSQRQSILRIGLPDQGVFQNMLFDKVAWCLGTPHKEPNLVTSSFSEEGGNVNEQAVTWEAVGPKLVDSVVYPLGWGSQKAALTSKTSEGGAKSHQSSQPLLYGNACVVSYGALNSGKSFALFGSINPPAPPPAPTQDSQNASAAAMGNRAANVKNKDDAFFYANKNRAKRQQMMHAGGKDEAAEGGNSKVAAKKGSISNEDLILKASQILPKDEVSSVVPTDGLIVRTVDALLKSPACSSTSTASSAAKTNSSHGQCELHMACLRLHNERLTDLCDLKDPTEQRTITTQLYYPDIQHASGHVTAASAANTDSPRDVDGAVVNEGKLYYYGLRGVRPTKVANIGEVKELLVRARQQIQRAPEGYLAKDVVESTKGKVNEKDLAVKAAAAEDKKKGGVAAKKKAEEVAAEQNQIAAASAVHGSTMIVVLYLVPKKVDGKSQPQKPSSNEANTLPPRAAMQKIMFVDLPYSNSISKGVSSTSINAGKELAFTVHSESAETPLQTSNDRAINAMFLALGSSLADSVKYGRSRYPQHHYLLKGNAGALDDLLGSAATAAVTKGSGGQGGEGVGTSTGPTHYRNSTLTRILKEATYGPNTFTAVLGCVSPSPSDVTFSHHTLRFLQAIKNQPVTTVGFAEMEALRLGEVTNIDHLVVGSLPTKASKAFDLLVERKAAEKAKVNPYITMKTGGTVSSGAVASLAPPNVKREENSFFKNEANVRAELVQEYYRDMTALQKLDVNTRLAISKKANMPRKLAEAIAEGNAAIGTSAAQRKKTVVGDDEENIDDEAVGAELDFETQFRIPHKITTSPSTHTRSHITHDTSNFIRQHHEKYRFRDEAKGKALVTTNTFEMSNRAYAEKLVHEDEVKTLAATGQVARPKHKKEGPPKIAHKKHSTAASSPETSTNSENVSPKAPHKPAGNSSPQRPQPKAATKDAKNPAAIPPPPQEKRPNEQSPRTKQLQPPSASSIAPPPTTNKEDNSKSRSNSSVSYKSDHSTPPEHPESKKSPEASAADDYQEDDFEY